MAPALARTGRLGKPDGEAPAEDKSAKPAPASTEDKNTSNESPNEVVPAPATAAEPMSPADAQKLAAFVTMARKIHSYVENNFENVGKELPEEARKIHYGETQNRNIFGQATPEEAEELREEGIDLHALPRLPKLDG